MHLTMIKRIESLDDRIHVIGKERWYTGSPKEAVLAAHAQERGDYNTWDYAKRYQAEIVDGQHTIACGNWAAAK